MHPEPSLELDAATALRGIVAAIPARYASTRLPGKVLRPLAGRPMIEHVYRRAGAARGLSAVVVLTDDERVGAAVAAFGGLWQLTSAACASGTDRIAEAARGWPEVQAVVNVQGDEPLIDPEAISRVAEHLARFPEDPVVTLAAAAESGDLADPNVVKVVLDRCGYALYFSRAGIPYPRGAGGAPALRHVGVYGYQRAALLRLATLPPAPLERAESLEQLRALENGVAIRVLLAEAAGIGVDTEEDLARAEALFGERGRSTDGDAG